MTRLACMVLLFGGGCGTETLHFVESPWPADSSAVVIVTTPTAEPVGIRQLAPGQELTLELPPRGRLFARSFLPDAVLNDTPIADCPLELGGEGWLAPDRSGHWVTDTFDDGAPLAFGAEVGEPRSFDLRSEACTPPPVDVCAALVFEDLAFPNKFSPESVVAAADDTFFVGGGTREGNARLFRFDAAGFEELLIGVSASQISSLETFRDGFLYAVLQPGGRLVRLTDQGVLVDELRSGITDLTGSQFTIIANSRTEAFELRGSRLERLIDPPEAIEHFTVWARSSGALQAVSNIYAWQVTSWKEQNPATIVPTGLRMVGATSRLFLLDRDRTIYINTGGSDWATRRIPASDGPGVLLTATDTVKSELVAGEGLLAVAQSGQWCVQEDLRFDYVDSERLNEQTMVVVSDDKVLTRARVLLVRD